MGVTVAALGVISLVAAKWNTIPARLKLSAVFTIFGVPAACLYRFSDGSNAPSWSLTATPNRLP